MGRSCSGRPFAKPYSQIGGEAERRRDVTRMRRIREGSRRSAPGVAVVADVAWIRALSGLGHFFVKAELKVFEPAQLSEARARIAAT
jgi:hypothetical protein